MVCGDAKKECVLPIDELNNINKKYCCPECKSLLAKYAEQANCKGVWAYCKKCKKERELKIEGDLHDPEM